MVARPNPSKSRNPLRQWFVGRFYADYARSKRIKKALDRALAPLETGDSWGVNIGSDGKHLHSRMLNLDISNAETVDIIGDAMHLPFADNVLSVAVSQEVLEHLPDPRKAVQEAARALRPGGVLYIQTPFIIGYHSGPRDYWRFSQDGMAELIRYAGLEVVEIGAALGPGTSAHRVLVEFMATVAGSISPRLYHAAKGVAALLFWPLKLADAIEQHSDTNRISGGFYAIGKKS
jgi:SAM-dependent methyltransferase